jgi:heme oxygenase (biliverdin-IX-beta and delta-forming)
VREPVDAAQGARDLRTARFLLVDDDMDLGPVHSLARSPLRSSPLLSSLHTADLVAALLDPDGPRVVPRAAPAPAPEALLQRLTRETARAKAQLDQSSAIPAPAISERRYLRYCAAWWGFYAPLERQLRGVSGLDRALADLGRRWKTELLELDLAELGVGVPELALPTCKKLPNVSELPRALGACYALELCTLGHRHIQRYLSHVMPSMTSRASHYLSSYDSETEALWATLGEQMRAALGNASGAVQDAVVEGAVETLLLARAWFERSFAVADDLCGDRLAARAGARAAARASWGAELERALLRTWPQLGLSLPPWTELERTLLLWVPWGRAGLRREHDYPSSG